MNFLFFLEKAPIDKKREIRKIRNANYKVNQFVLYLHKDKIMSILLNLYRHILIKLSKTEKIKKIWCQFYQLFFVPNTPDLNYKKQWQTSNTQKMIIIQKWNRVFLIRDIFYLSIQTLRIIPLIVPGSEKILSYAYRNKLWMQIE